MLKRVLIANRGEIALRVRRACREAGIETVSVYSQADAEALHVQLAPRSVCIGPPRAADSYLNPQALLSAAIATGCDGLHPGYGFLSENPEFADACAENGRNAAGAGGAQGVCGGTACGAIGGMNGTLEKEETRMRLILRKR